MKTGYLMLRRVGVVTALVVGIALPAVGRAADADDEKEPKGATTIVLEHPVARVQQAAVNALAVIGCKLRKTEPTYLEGKRSNKVGLVVGSGGEMIKVWLTADGPNRTSLKVATVKSMFGYAGQRSWNEKVLEEVRKDLAAPAAPPAASN